MIVIAIVQEIYIDVVKPAIQGVYALVALTISFLVLSCDQ